MPQSSRAAPSVVLDAVCAGYGADPPVFTDLCLALEGAGLTHVTGPNGAGKSTFLELVSGYLRPRSGSVTVCGLPAGSPRARAVRRVVRTQPALYGDMTVSDHLAFTRRFVGEHPDGRHRTWERAEQYGLGPWMDTAAGQLSTGNARKLWLVMTTAGSAAAMVLDEPFNALDAHGCEVLVGELVTWAHERQVLLVAHDLPAGLVADQQVSLAVEGALR